MENEVIPRGVFCDRKKPTDLLSQPGLRVQRYYLQTETAKKHTLSNYMLKYFAFINYCSLLLYFFFLRHTTLRYVEFTYCV